MSNLYDVPHPSLLAHVPLRLENSLEDFTAGFLTQDGERHCNEPLPIHFANGVYEKTGETAHCSITLPITHCQAPGGCELKNSPAALTGINCFHGCHILGPGQ